MELPLSLYSCGLHPQHAIHRPIGYPTFQCIFCFGGSGTFYFEREPELRIGRGNILILPSKLAHDYSPYGTEPWIVGYMGLEGALVESLISALQLPVLSTIVVNEHEMEQLELDLRQLWHRREYGDSDSHRFASTEIYRILAYIAAIIHKDKPQQHYRNNASVKELLRAAVRFMEQHYMENLSLANIANTVGYSQQHFQRKFKEAYGMNPSQYLQRLRLLKGAQLLETGPELSVGDVAAMVGMEFNYFVRLFKQEHGITPAKYRFNVRQISNEKPSI
nr:AraC family transcriptional regulator [Paenibacillus glycanilyticus]